MIHDINNVCVCGVDLHLYCPVGLQVLHAVSCGNYARGGRVGQY